MATMATVVVRRDGDGWALYVDGRLVAGGFSDREAAERAAEESGWSRNRIRSLPALRSRGFYFVRIDGRAAGRTFATKRAATAAARRAARGFSQRHTHSAAQPHEVTCEHGEHRVSVWFRDLVGQDIPVSWKV